MGHECTEKSCQVRCSHPEATLEPQQIRMSRVINCRSRMAFDGQWRPRIRKNSQGQPIKLIISCIAPRDSENSAVKPMIPQPTKEVTTVTTSPSMTKLCGDVKTFVKIGENVTVTCSGGSECQFKCSDPNTFPTKNGVRCRKGRFQPANLRNELVDCSSDPPCGHPKDF